MTEPWEAEEPQTTWVLAMLLHLIPEFDPEQTSLPCPQVQGETHSGLRIGAPGHGYVLFHRCRSRWWMRQLTPGSEFNYRDVTEVLAAPAYDFGPVDPHDGADTDLIQAARRQGAADLIAQYLRGNR